MGMILVFLWMEWCVYGRGEVCLGQVVGHRPWPSSMLGTERGAVPFPNSFERPLRKCFSVMQDRWLL